MKFVNDGPLIEEIACRLEELGLRVRTGGLADAGLDLIVAVPGQGGVTEVGLEVKTTDAAIPPSTLLRLREPGRLPVIVAQRHIPRGRGDRYRAAGVPYIDSGGNAWMSFPGFIAQVEGRRPRIEPIVGVDRPSRALRPAGLQLVFALLVKPALVEAPLRVMAHASRVSLGAVQGALADLRGQGFVFESRTGERRLDDAERLAELWLARYVTDLGPKVAETRLEGAAPDWWLQEGRWRDMGVELSGETALSRLGYPIRPTTTTMYGEAPWHTARRMGRLIRGELPNVFLRQRFWDPDILGSGEVVPGLLVYADSLASGDSRQAEIAREMWDHDADLRRFRPGRALPAT